MDKFVLVEATTTHSNLPKPLYFEERQEEFKNYPIEHLIMKYEGPEVGPWALENRQRNCINWAFEKLQPHDFVLVGDVDEIPDPRFVGKGEFVYNMRDHYWKWNMMHPNRWNGTVQVMGHRFSSKYGKIRPQDCRNFRDLMLRIQAGWHFSWSTDVETKQRSFAHTELQGRKFDYTMHPCDGNRLIHLPVNEQYDWPKPLLDNPQRWEEYIAK